MHKKCCKSRLSKIKGIELSPGSLHTDSMQCFFSPLVIGRAATYESCPCGDWLERKFTHTCTGHATEKMWSGIHCLRTYGNPGIYFHKVRFTTDHIWTKSQCKLFLLILPFPNDTQACTLQGVQQYWPSDL